MWGVGFGVSVDQVLLADDIGLSHVNEVYKTRTWVNYRRLRLSYAHAPSFCVSLHGPSGAFWQSA